MRGADVAIDPLDGDGVLATEHGAGQHALLDDGDAVDDEGLAFDALDLFQLLGAQAQGGLQAELGTDLAELEAQPLRGVDAQPLGHRRVEGLDALLGVDRDHAIAELGQDGVEALALGQLDARGTRYFDGVFERLTHGVHRVQEDTSEADLVGHVGGHAGADDDLDPPLAATRALRPRASSSVR